VLWNSPPSSGGRNSKTRLYQVILYKRPPDLYKPRCAARDTVETVTTTVLKSLADLPTAETPAQERRRKLAERKERIGSARSYKQRDLERKQRERTEQGTVTWIEPVPIKPGSRTMVVGVCSDADPAVVREYGVRL
jgi:hypothetical protein